jgi:hypothetical protein
MTSRKYTNRDGVEVTAWEVRLEQMEMLYPKDSGARPAAASANGASAEWETSPDDLPF